MAANVTDNNKKPNMARWLAILLIPVILGMVPLLLTYCDSAESDTPEKTGFLPENSDSVTVTPAFVDRPILKTAYVSAMCLNVRGEPTSKSEIIGHVFQGDAVTIYEEKTSNGRVTWYLAADEAGFVEGWMSARYITDQAVKSSFTQVSLDEYRGAKTPTVIDDIDAQYLGVSSCVPCHSNAHAGFSKGPYGVWRDHFHSSAFETLKRDYTKAFAKKRGIIDPVTNWRCRKCHVTAYGVEPKRLGPNYSDAEGVGCETCHGPGGKYLNEHYREGVTDAELEAMGFRVYRNLEERDLLCRSCHNELSPTYKPFNVVEFSKAIRHWEKEFTIDAGDPEVMPVIGSREVVPVKPVPVTEEEIREAVTPPPPKEDPAPAIAATKVDDSESPHLAGLAQDWIMNRTGERGEVFFPHLMHIANHVEVENEANVCQVCHHTTKPGVRPTNCSDGGCHKFEATEVVSRKKAFHGTCRTCHRETNSGPQKCSQCHNSESSLAAGF